MVKANTNATNDYSPLQNARLTVAQENAVDALVAGRKDADAAALVGVNRVTVTRWRLYNPHFRAALNERRQAIWAASLDRLRSLVPLALEAVSDALKDSDSPNRLEAAIALLKLLKLDLGPTGPTDPAEIVRGMVEEKRQNARGFMADIDDNRKGLVPFREDVRRTWDDLAAKLEPSAEV